MPRSRGRSVLLGSLALALCWTLVEALAWLGYWGMTGTPLHAHALREARAVLVGEAAAVDPAAQLGRIPATRLVPHPFLGFVYNPDFDASHGVHSHPVPVSAWGFLDYASPIVAPRPDEAVIGIFGGSVAFWTSYYGIDALLEELGRAPEFVGKRLRVVRTALGGFKQPQQLATLAYLLALGAHFDAIINLDGVNEVSLAEGNLVAQGVFAAYPRDWPALLGEAGGSERLRLVGEITFLRSERGRWAKRFRGRILRRSAVANLVWAAFDARLEQALQRAQLALEENAVAGAAGGGTGVASGPLQRSLTYGSRGPQRQYDSPEELYRDLAQLWQRSSLQMHRLATAAGIRYYHFLQPNQYVAGSKPMGADERKLALQPGNAFDRGARYGYPLLQRGGRELSEAGVAFTDLTQVFADASEPLYIDVCCHLSPEGNQRLGRAIGRSIAERQARERLEHGAQPTAAPVAR